MTGGPFREMNGLVEALPGHGRRVLHARLDGPRAVAAAAESLPSNFIAMTIWDATRVSTEEIAVVLDALILGGCGYLITHGPDCERVHDIADECYVGHDLEGSLPARGEDAVFMTAWTAGEPLNDALHFAVHTAWPNLYGEPATDAAVTVAILELTPLEDGELERALAAMDA